MLSGTDDVFFCANVDQCDCNWRVPEGQRFCRACVLNKIIPDLAIVGNRERWTRVEAAKKRAIYSLLAFGLPVGPKSDPGDEIGLAFDFLADPGGIAPGGEHILTGHDNGLITLNVAEADSAEREKMRVQMGEQLPNAARSFPPRARSLLLGPADSRRCRIGWSASGRPSATSAQTMPKRSAATMRMVAPPDWQARHISAYAASHPWEDWAETFAHHLHITDTLEMVHALNFPLGRLDTVQANQLARSDTAAGSMPVGAGGHADRPNRSRPYSIAGWCCRKRRTRSTAAWACPISTRSSSRRRPRASSVSCMS